MDFNGAYDIPLKSLRQTEDATSNKKWKKKNEKRDNKKGELIRAEVVKTGGR